MTGVPDWWRAPRRISIVTDADSWIVPHAGQLVSAPGRPEDEAGLFDDHAAVPPGAVAFYLGYSRIVPPEALARNHRNLVAHASPLPQGRGMSPLTWQILRGDNRIPVCLFEAVEALDAGPVIYRDELAFEGHELIDEMRAKLGGLIVTLCRRFLDEPAPPPGVPQSGESSRWPLRRPRDSALDPDSSLAAQFNLLRVVDNERYPAYFDWRGYRYRLRIDKLGPSDDSES